MWWFIGHPAQHDDNDADGLLLFDPVTGVATGYDRRAGTGPPEREWIPAFAVSPAGSVFVGTTRNGLLRLEPASDAWRSYMALDGLPGDHIGTLAVEPGGAIWLAACNSAVPACDHDRSNARPRGQINILVRYAVL